MGEGNRKSNEGRVNVSRFLDTMARDQGCVPALMVPRGRTGNGDIDYLTLSFSELSEEQDLWAARLQAAGIGRGSRTLLMVKPGLPLIAICFALFKIGAVPIVIDPGMGLKSFLSCVRRSRPEYLVGITLAAVVSRVFFKTFSSVRARVRVGGPLARAPRLVESKGIEAADTRSDDLAAVLFTSGSTGAPKGVCYEHGMFEGQVEAIRDRFSIEPGEVDLPMLPIFALFNPALGMTTVVPEINPSKPATVDPEKIVQAIRQCGVTNSFGSPVLWKKIGVYCEKESIRLPSLKRILMAGAPVPPELMRLYRSILGEGHVYSPYGATEVLPVSAISDVEVIEETAELTARGKGTCVGTPAPGVEIRILSHTIEGASFSDAVPQGGVGEIVVTGPTVTKEYDQLPDATAKAKILADDGRVWHRMGDLGYLDEVGRLWFCGRKVERVLTETREYFTDCCEGVFNGHSDVFRTALVGYSGSNGVFPAIVVEPMDGRMPQSEGEKQSFTKSLREMARGIDGAEDIENFFYYGPFPVDVRHNAKIHRLDLAAMILK